MFFRSALSLSIDGRHLCASLDIRGETALGIVQSTRKHSREQINQQTHPRVRVYYKGYSRVQSHSWSVVITQSRGDRPRTQQSGQYKKINTAISHWSGHICHPINWEVPQRWPKSISPLETVWSDSLWRKTRGAKINNETEKGQTSNWNLPIWLDLPISVHCLHLIGKTNVFCRPVLPLGKWEFYSGAYFTWQFSIL